MDTPRNEIKTPIPTAINRPYLLLAGGALRWEDCSGRGERGGGRGGRGGREAGLGKGGGIGGGRYVSEGVGGYSGVDRRDSRDSLVGGCRNEEIKTTCAFQKKCPIFH